MLAPPRRYLIFKRIEEMDFTFPEHFPPHARELVSALLRRAGLG